MKLRIERSVCIITATLGEPSLARAIESVEEQIYGNLTHLIVADGIDAHDKILANPEMVFDRPNRLFVTTPYQTGVGFWGHRIYAAYPHLVDHDYVMFLDSDNWLDKEHVRSLVDLIEEKSLDWAHSLRKVYTSPVDYLAADNCESIGRWPIWFTQDTEQPAHLVDTSSYCFKREFLIQCCHIWHHGWGGDRRFFNAIKDQTNYATTGLYTLNYVLPDIDKAYGGDREFFAKGNVEVLKKYNGKYPWSKEE